MELDISQVVYWEGVSWKVALLKHACGKRVSVRLRP